MRHPPQESDQIPGRGVTGTVLGTVLVIVVSVVIAFSIARCRTTSLGRGAFPPAAATIPGEVNQLETRVFAVEAQGLAGHVRAMRYLESYGWINPEKRLVHVPIDVAMRLYLARKARGPRPAVGGER